MQNLLEKYFALRAPEDGGGGNAAAPAGGGDGAADPGAGGGSSGDPGGQTAGDGGNAPPSPVAGASGPYRPDGLPDTMFGENDQQTIDKLHQAMKGYRERDSQRQVPENVDAYREFKLDELPEAVRPHLEALSKDPLFDAVSQVALEEKVPASTMQKITAKLYEQAAEMGILDHVVDPMKERQALLPETAANLPKAEQDRAIDARLQANEDFIKLQVQNGLPQDVADHGLLMLMDTAQGNQLIEFFMSKMTGGDRAQPLPGEGSGNGSGKTAREQLRAELAKPEMQAGHPSFNREAYDGLMDRYRREIGE